MGIVFAWMALGFASLHAGQVTVAVAANVSYALDDLKKAFAKEHPGIEIRTILGSSGKLTAQIGNGAPYDLFMAANMAYPEALYRGGTAVTKPKVYAKGALALLSPTPRDFDEGLKTLLSPSIRRIAVANPKAAPYGEAAVEALKNAGLYDRIRSKLIYGESVSQTLAYTLHAADVGIVAKSSLFSPKLRRFEKGKNWIDIDATLYRPIDQGIVLLKQAQKNPDARAFYDFVLGKKAQAIFKAYGYLLP